MRAVSRRALFLPVAALPVLAAPALADIPTNLPPVAPVAPGGTNAAPTALVVTTPAAAQFDSAMSFFNAGQYVDAAQAFTTWLQTFPQDRRREEALYRLAESYRNLGRNEDALAAYTFQAATYPDGPFRANAELRRGAIFFDAGKFANAATALQFPADHGVGDLQLAAKYLLGRADLALKKEPEARALLQPLADAQPPSKFAGNAAEALAELDDAQGHPADALPLWQKALALSADPKQQAIFAARGGWAALASNQPDVAETLFQKARELNATGDVRKVANTGLLRVLFAKKRFGEWVSVYAVEKDLLLDSARAETLYDLAHAQFSLKHWSDAITAFDQYLREFPAQDNAVGAAYERFLAYAQSDPATTPEQAGAYLKQYPQSPYRAQVQLLEAQELSREKKFADAVPLWESLANEPAAQDWPHQEILLERARAYDELHNWPKAATSYQAWLDEVGANPNPGPALATRKLRIEARVAACLQNDSQLRAATEAWKLVQSDSANHPAEQQMALESLGLIYAKGGPAQLPDAVATFRTLLDKFPQTPLRALAAFSVGDGLFQNRDYNGAIPFLENARRWDAKAWEQPATQRLALAVYGLKNDGQTIEYVKQYDTIPLPADPQAAAAARLPAALFYWLAETARAASRWSEAEAFYTRVTQHPDAGNLLAGAWYQLGQVQSREKAWPAAVAAYQKFRELKPETKDASTVLLALGRAQLGAKNFEAAKALGNQVLLNEPEGKNSAAARMLLGDTAFDAGAFPDAARMYATVAILFNDPAQTPLAMSRAAAAFERAGDAKSAADWRQKLQAKYPGYQPPPAE